MKHVRVTSSTRASIMRASDREIAATVDTLRNQLAASFPARHREIGRDLSRLSLLKLRQIQACGRL